MKKELFEQLTESLREAGQIKRGALKPSRVFHVNSKNDLVKVRGRLGLSQSRFAALLGISADTLQNWEQGRREPTASAKVLLKIALKHRASCWRLRNGWWHSCGSPCLRGEPLVGRASSASLINVKGRAAPKPTSRASTSGQADAVEPGGMIRPLRIAEVVGITATTGADQLRIIPIGDFDVRLYYGAALPPLTRVSTDYG